ncbi:hypothetical protein HPB50_006503 [Hyalomma asiaticum]|uniref:Uncharacterized protein n=1 Tax=Hyalomma asiaticum TaxID=266040 RepID=A0ACB7TFT3_HYAAI|nr:hypothetical protein HPB50_006503 [Hyalomma asiaticum]
MTARLNATLPVDEGPYTAKQVRLKLDNLNKRYRKLRRTATTTGSKAITWPFYRRLHEFLGTLPINDDLLVEENLEVEQEPALPECAQLIGSWEICDVSIEDNTLNQGVTVDPAADLIGGPPTDSPQHGEGSENKWFNVSLFCNSCLHVNTPTSSESLLRLHTVQEDGCEVSSRRRKGIAFSGISASPIIRPPWEDATLQTSTDKRSPRLSGRHKGCCAGLATPSSASTTTTPRREALRDLQQHQRRLSPRLLQGAELQAAVRRSPQLLIVFRSATPPHSALCDLLRLFDTQAGYAAAAEEAS